MPLSAAIPFALRAIPAITAPAVAPFFDRLPVDPYITGHFRSRRLSRLRLIDGRQVHLPHGDFLQSADYNHLLGNIRRDYPEIEDGFLALPAFQSVVAAFAAFFAITAQRVLGVHQIRIVATRAESGHPAPEGIHQDGFDHIGIICAARVGVTGAETRLYSDPAGAPIFARELAAGDAVWVDDRNAFHFTSPLQPVGDAPGHRDVLVITA